MLFRNIENLSTKLFPPNFGIYSTDSKASKKDNFASSNYINKIYKPSLFIIQNSKSKRCKRKNNFYRNVKKNIVKEAGESENNHCLLSIYCSSPNAHSNNFDETNEDKTLMSEKNFVNTVNLKFLNKSNNEFSEYEETLKINTMHNFSHCVRQQFDLNEANFSSNINNKQSRKYKSKVTMISPSICPHCNMEPGQYQNIIFHEKLDWSKAQSKCGSLHNIKHVPGGGQDKIYDENLDWSHIKSRCGTLDNIGHVPGGGQDKVYDEKLDWSHIKSRCGTLDNIGHVPGGGQDKVYDEKLDWSHIKSRCGTLDNIDHVPGGGEDLIYDEKLDWSHIKSRCGTLDNIDHVPGGGVYAITCKCGYLKYAEHVPGYGESKIFYMKDPYSSPRSLYSKSVVEQEDKEKDSKRTRSTKKSSRQKPPSTISYLRKSKVSKKRTNSEKNKSLTKKGSVLYASSKSYSHDDKAPIKKSRVQVVKSNLPTYMRFGLHFSSSSNLENNLIKKQSINKERKTNLDFYNRFRLTMLPYSSDAITTSNTDNDSDDQKQSTIKENLQDAVKGSTEQDSLKHTFQLKENIEPPTGKICEEKQSVLSRLSKMFACFHSKRKQKNTISNWDFID